MTQTTDAPVTTGTYAKVIADSVSPAGDRLTTVEVRFHRFVLAEFNTHRALSKNSASSRAIPFEKQAKRVWDAPALPVAWAAEQKGMQGGAGLSEGAVDEAERIWWEAAAKAVTKAEELRVLGEGDEVLHKSLVNRLLEPFMWHTAVVTGTAWENFFDQRCSPLAQPEIRVAAEAIRTAMAASTPRTLPRGAWHLPYIEEQDWAAMRDRFGLTRLGQDMGEEMAKVSAARCARVSYLTHDGTRSIAADLDLYEKLTTAEPPHWSPLEHVATPWTSNRGEGMLDVSMPWDPAARYVDLSTRPKVGNLLGWQSLRTTVEAAQGKETYR